MGTDNGNKPYDKIALPEAKRVRASAPLLILAVLFIIASFLTWYFTWFGRGLSDADITKYLADEAYPRHVQHAMLQIEERMEHGDQSVKQWYPRLIALAGSQETEFRLTVAWLMGADNSSPEFHSALKQLLLDSQPIVRRNAALALVRFNDSSGHAELITMLQPFTVTAPVTGVLQSSLAAGANLSRGSLVGRILEPTNNVNEIRSPLNGEVDQILVNSGSSVSSGQPLLTLRSDEQGTWEALRGLAVIGNESDLELIDGIVKGTNGATDRIKQQANLTAGAIRARHKTN